MDGRPNPTRCLDRFEQLFLKFRLDLSQGTRQLEYNFIVFIMHLIFYNNIYFLKYKIILYYMFFIIFRKYINLYLFFCYYFEILSYLLFKFSYKHIKIIL